MHVLLALKTIFSSFEKKGFKRFHHVVNMEIINNNNNNAIILLEINHLRVDEKIYRVMGGMDKIVNN